MNKQVKKLILAPMEGVIDALMRDLLTSVNNYDLCITEFVRVVDSLVPKHSYYKICPELLTNSKTLSNTPIRIQLLGQEPNWLAENANRAIELGSYGIDINFGCPAKAVNKSKGGAVLLNDPELIYQIMHSVKSAVNKSHSVSAKIRLGFNDSNKFHEIVDAVSQAGTNMLTIHARTKKDGYKPPAYWHHISEIAQSYSMDIIANGEIWSRADAEQCLVASNTDMLMLGRGALALPNLANVIRYNEAPMNELALKQLLLKYSLNVEQTIKNYYYYPSRLKQWLKYLKKQYSSSEQLFEQIKTLSDKKTIQHIIKML